MKSDTARSSRKPAHARRAAAASGSQALRLEEFYRAGAVEEPQALVPRDPASAAAGVVRSPRPGPAGGNAAARTAAEIALWAELADRSDPGSSLSSGSSVAAGAAALPQGAPPPPDTSGVVPDRLRDDEVAATPAGGVESLGEAPSGPRTTASNPPFGLPGRPLPKDNE